LSCQSCQSRTPVRRVGLVRRDWSIQHPVTHVSVGHHLPSRNTPPSDRGKGPPTDRTTPDCTSTSQLPVRPSLSYLNKELTARAANYLHLLTLTVFAPMTAGKPNSSSLDSWKQRQELSVQDIYITKGIHQNHFSAPSFASHVQMRQRQPY
jgi:hypothetical protein